MCEALLKAMDVGVERRWVADAHGVKIARLRFWIGFDECRVETMISQSWIVKHVAVSVRLAKVSENPAEKLRVQDREGCQRA